ncbi:QueT transporter family protein [Oceanobacillus alkalisoli]|uniref:QueT transporter family protein n=1 Tax=Oceanobacillus alkalisoli TaxID=2925113 RepID=UPI001EE4842D|nr:QueT transporter family protein [Oceanobacillus alkalisoli]MCG5102855.1 QueT transporter family protein [Oceanobacillus alkalisoli]
MNSSIAHEESLTSIRSIVKISLVSALYMAVTLILSVISFGPIQLRLSEMFNYLALFHKRYIVAVFLGVVIANFMSPMWFIDVPIGGLATLAVLLAARALTKNIKNVKAKFVVTAIIFTLSMFTVAVQLYILFNLPFWMTYLTVALGELLSMTIGGFIMYMVSKRVDLTK